jgi:predicted secreted Zn-dependent protease
MKKAAIVFLVLISQTVASIAQTTSQNLIEWNEFYTLSWEDFEGVRTGGSIGDAGTAVSIKAKPYMVKNKVKYNVYAYFNREKSWATDKSEELLKHEQLHFDIAELYARKIRKRISELSASGVNDVKIYNEEIQELLDESNSADIQYDLETLHGALVKRQATWEKNVKQELEALAKYKKVRKVITS